MQNNLDQNKIQKYLEISRITQLYLILSITTFVVTVLFGALFSYAFIINSLSWKICTGSGLVLFLGIFVGVMVLFFINLKRRNTMKKQEFTNLD